MYRMTWEEFNIKHPSFAEFLASFAPPSDDPSYPMELLGFEGFYGKSGRRLKGAPEKAKRAGFHPEIVEVAGTLDEVLPLLRRKKQVQWAQELYDMYSDMLDMSPEEIRCWQVQMIRSRHHVHDMFIKDEDLL